MPATRKPHHPQQPTRRIPTREEIENYLADAELDDLSPDPLSVVDQRERALDFGLEDASAFPNLLPAD
jgi:hypothetical protein